MRKTTFALGFGLALSLGAANVQAQRPAPRDTAKAGDQARRGPRGEGRFQRGDRGPGALLKGITLTEAQKNQLKTLREQQRASRESTRDTGKAAFEAARAARQRGDTAAVRRLTEQRQAQFERARTQEIAALRQILATDQRVTFDRNVAAMKAQQEKRAAGIRGRGTQGRPGRVRAGA